MRVRVRLPWRLQGLSLSCTVLHAVHWRHVIRTMPVSSDKCALYVIAECAWLRACSRRGCPRCLQVKALHAEIWAAEHEAQQLEAQHQHLKRQQAALQVCRGRASAPFSAVLGGLGDWDVWGLPV